MLVYFILQIISLEETDMIKKFYNVLNLIIKDKVWREEEIRKVMFMLKP
jgi:hypothetical protein